MAKATSSEKVTVPVPKPKGTPTKTDLDAISAAIAARLKRNRLGLIAMLIGAISVFLAFQSPGAALGFATLYMFAYNGKVSGRHDGNVLMANGRGRGYATPALVRNTYTMTQRGIFSTLSSSFRGLTAAEILAWNNTSLQATNRLGQAITVKGKDLYVALNANLIDIGAATITGPPVFTGVTTINDITSLTIDASAGTASLAFGVSPTAGTVDHLLFATAPLSAGVSRPSKSAFRLVDVIPATSTTPWSFGTAYTNKFGTIAGSAGMKVFVQLYGVENTTGQKTPSVGFGAVIVP